MHIRVLKYQQSIPENLANKSKTNQHKVDIQNLFLARVYSSPAAWAKDLSFDTCFRSIASFCDPYHFSTTLPHSIHCAWNSRIWTFELQKILLSPKEFLKFCFSYKGFYVVASSPGSWMIAFFNKVWQPRRGYRDSARLLGESCTKKIEGPSGKTIAQKSRNSCEVNGRSCACIWTVDSGPKCAQS